MNTDIKIELEFYFVWDDMIVLKTKSYQDVLILAIKYYNKYGANHDYYLYIVNKHEFKDFIKIKSDN